MGQVLYRLREFENQNGEDENQQLAVKERFPDLTNLPPELSYTILSYLNATDLCLAGCVWDNLAKDDILWQGLCRNSWPYTAMYRRRFEPGFSYRQVYLLLDEGVVLFNSCPNEGIQYLIRHGLVIDTPEEIARFLHKAKYVHWKAKRQYLENRRDIVDHLITLQNFENQFLPNALRKFFNEVHAPNERGTYLHFLVDKFSERFCSCNPRLGLSPDAVYVICFSLIMLSVDLCSPHVKNKMSKREFIRNTRRATQGVNDDFAGHCYDNIYLIGHVAPKV
ncbi:F-box only protein 8-like [Lineus longissimus]|uniref:F-box only protein 8-like n=1 Tax=Lineus longissimus TaxID=88925 RepID=UPI002B4EA3F6